MLVYAVMGFFSLTIYEPRPLQRSLFFLTYMHLVAVSFDFRKDVLKTALKSEVVKCIDKARIVNKGKILDDLWPHLNHAKK